MAVTVGTLRPARREAPWRPFGAAALILVAFLLLVLPAAATLRWLSPFLLLPAAWWTHTLYQTAVRSRHKREIGARLTRLPDDFIILHHVTLPAPWGKAHFDQVVVSRFGLVVISAGIPQGSMCERVEALRTLLFQHGHLRPALKVIPLVLLPPRSRPAHLAESNVRVVGVEHLRFDHLAPHQQPVLTDQQVRAMAQCLLNASL